MSTHLEKNFPIVICN